MNESVSPDGRCVLRVKRLRIMPVEGGPGLEVEARGELTLVPDVPVEVPADGPGDTGPYTLTWHPEVRSAGELEAEFEAWEQGLCHLGDVEWPPGLSSPRAL